MDGSKEIIHHSKELAQMINNNKINPIQIKTLFKNKHQKHNTSEKLKSQSFETIGALRCRWWNLICHNKKNLQIKAEKANRSLSGQKQVILEK